jgi:hypothetical protein
LSYIRLSKHYVHLPYLYLGITEALLLMLAAWLAQRVDAYITRDAVDAETITFYWFPVLVFSIVMSCCTLSMGVTQPWCAKGMRA